MGALKGRPYTGCCGCESDRIAFGYVAKSPARRRRYRGSVLRCGCCIEKGTWITIWKLHHRELKQTLDRGEKVLLIDVREPWEYDLCNIEWVKVDSDGEHSGESAGAGFGRAGGVLLPPWDAEPGCYGVAAGARS